MAHDIESELCFLGRDPLYETEKPYSLRFDPLDDIPRHNLKIDSRRVTIADARALNATAERNGFTLATIPTKMKYGDFENPKAIETTYALEVQNYLKTMFGARYARIIDYNVSWVSNSMVFVGGGPASPFGFQRLIIAKQLSGSKTPSNIPYIYWNHVRASATSSICASR